jgi:hypothetical protein
VARERFKREPAAMVSKSPRLAKKIRKHIKPQAADVRVTIYLSQEATKNLEWLRLKLLDKRGRKPSGSQIIESLLAAAVGHEKVPYPTP